MRMGNLGARHDLPELNLARWGRSLAVGLGLVTLLMTAPAGLAQDTSTTGEVSEDTTVTTDESAGNTVTIGDDGTAPVEAAAPAAPADAAAAPPADAAATDTGAGAAAPSALPNTGTGSGAATPALAAMLAAVGALGAGAIALRHRRPLTRPAR